MNVYVPGLKGMVVTMNGIINVFKTAGMTSHDVVSFIRKRTGIRKVGHTGTLDPDAEGVLPICIGKATKVADMLTAQDKGYRAQLKLGISTDTQDASGVIISEKQVNVTEREIRQTVDSFIGNIKQVPPMYSAIKINGQKLYELARKGIEVKREPRDITIYDITISDIDLTNNTVMIDVHCSKGTYIRTLCVDIGEKLGCGAHMSSLLRTKSGIFTLDKAVSLQKIEQYSKENKVQELMIPVDHVFLQYAAITVNSEVEKKVLNGNEVDIKHITGIGEDQETYRVYNEQGQFLSLSSIIKKSNGISYLKIVKSFFEV